MSNSIELSSWVFPWAERKSKSLGFDKIEADEGRQEILVLFLQNKDRLQEIEGEQGEYAAKAFLGRVVQNHLKNLNADWSSQLTGMNGVARENDSPEVVAMKKMAMTGGVSLNQEFEDGDSLAEIIPDEGSLPVETQLDYEAVFEAAGILAPILSGAVNHPRDWCKKFPGSAGLLVENPALREMAVRRAVKSLAKTSQIDQEDLIKEVLKYLDGWRGARGEYGDGDEQAISPDEIGAMFSPCPEMAEHFPKGSALRAIALCLPLEEIPGYTPGFGEVLLRQAESEATSVAAKYSLSKPDQEDFVERSVNYARSYLKANGGLVKFVAVQERLQQDLFGFEGVA
jgi:hypothetical protein